MTNPTTELLKDTPPQGTTAERPQGAAGPAEDNPKLPEGCIPVLPVRGAVLFPATVLPLDAAAPKAAAAVQFAVKTQNPIGVLLQSDPEAETPGATQLAEVGTVAQVLRYIAAPDGRNHLICRGLREGAEAGGTNIDNRPPTLEQVFHSLAEFGHVAGVVGARMDFHGDGEDGNIDVVCTNSELGRWGKTSTFKHSSRSRPLKLSM